MKAMTEREIQFVRSLDRGVYGRVSDAELAEGLQGSHFHERVRFTIALEDFIKEIKVLVSPWLYRLQCWAQRIG